MCGNQKSGKWDPSEISIKNLRIVLDFQINQISKPMMMAMATQTRTLNSRGIR
jgi:hypothetical protein